MTRSFRGRTPQISAGAYVDPQTAIIGDVTIGADSSIWPCAELHGDYPIPRFDSPSTLRPRFQFA